MDTGAFIDILDEDTYNRVNHKNTLTLHKDADCIELKMSQRLIIKPVLSFVAVPENFRERAISIRAHEGHQGLVKTIQLLWEKLWFPKIDDRVKTRVDHYVACQANTSGSRPDPLQMSIYHHNHGTQFLWTFSHGLVFVCGD